MATAAVSPKTCAIQINLFSGARAPLPQGTEVLLTLRDGNQRDIRLPNNGYFRASSIKVNNLSFTNGLADRYTVVASARGFGQAGFTPVRLNPAGTAVCDLMLLPNDAQFNFRDARWDILQQTQRKMAALLRAGAADDAAAADRYTQLLENHAPKLACFFNLATAMKDIDLPVGSPLDYLRELIWEGEKAPAQDRFFAWADRRLVDQVALAAAEGVFEPEPGTAIFHPGASRSWKEVRFGEANVQLTFHESESRVIAGVECTIVEPDIDYFKDPLAHALLEVVQNRLTHGVTDPRQVYVLRWIAGRHAGVPNFEPPYILA